MPRWRDFNVDKPDVVTWNLIGRGAAEITTKLVEDVATTHSATSPRQSARSARAIAIVCGTGGIGSSLGEESADTAFVDGVRKRATSTPRYAGLSIC